MGANVQCNSYFPGYYTPRNLSLDADASSWPQNHVDNISESGNLCNAFLSPDYLLAYNKEFLKQTMLKHETIFKDQIQELHRLYRRQRELMVEIQRNELGKHYLRSNASNPTVASMYVQKNFQVPGFPLTILPTSQVSVSGPESIKSRISVVQEMKAQACPSYLVKSEACSEDIQSLEAKCSKVGKKILDLRLPADEYIDCDDTDDKVSEWPKVLSYSMNRSPQVVYTGNVKPFFGCNVLSPAFHGTTATPALVLENQKQLVDPTISHRLEEQATYLSNGFAGPTSHRNLHCHEPSVKTSAVFQSSLGESIQNTQGRSNLDILANLVHSETGKPEQISYHNKTGKCGSLQGFSADNYPLSYKLASNDLEKAFRPPTLEQGNHMLYSERTIYGLENCQRNSASLSNSLNGPHHDAFSQSNFDDHGSLIKKNSESTLNLRELCDSKCNQISVQGLPCFITSEPLVKRYKQSDSNGLQEHNDSRNFPSSPVASLNSNPPRRCSEIRVPDCNYTSNGVEKNEYSGSTFSWPRAKSAHKGKDNTGIVNTTQVASVCLQDCSEANYVTEPKKAETTGSSSELTLVSDDCNKSFISVGKFASLSNPSKPCRKLFGDVKRNGRCTVLDLNMACDSLVESEFDRIVDEKTVGNRADREDSGFGCLFDLNSSINEAEFPEKPPLTGKHDLDAPLSPENKECSPPRGESDTNLVEMPLQLSGQDDVDPQDEIARIAAETIVSLTALQNAISTDLGAASHDSLQWFANIVSSVSSATDKKNENCMELLLPDEVDYFEAMTLNLAETKPEEISYKSNPSKEEETGTSSSPSQQRKGRARRGRQQRKDFQREILPSLASLSRYEVTEDLQTISGLMEAAGAHWETGPTRYAARNRCSRAQKLSLVVSGSDAVVGFGSSAVSLLKQISSSDSNSTVGKEERSVICWGKVTKRRRGQRYPVRVRNQQLIPSQI